MTMRVAQRARSRDGFTLVETLVSLLVLGIFVGLFSMVMTSTIRHWNVIEKQTVLQVEARAVADTLAVDLRQASSGVDGTCPISVATATSLQFFSPDRSEPSHQRTVAVRLAGGKLERAVSTSTNTAPPWTGMWTTPPASAWTKRVALANTSVFSYYDASGAALAAPVAAGSLKLIKGIRIQLTTSAAGSGGNTTSYETLATPRVSSC